MSSYTCECGIIVGIRESHRCTHTEAQSAKLRQILNTTSKPLRHDWEIHPTLSGLDRCRGCGCTRNDLMGGRCGGSTND